MYKTLFLLLLIPFQLRAQTFSKSWEQIISGIKIPSNVNSSVVISDNNGDFIIAGEKDTSVVSQLWLTKIDPNGNVLFDVTHFQGSVENLISYAAVTDINNNIFVGYSWTDSLENQHPGLIKFNSIGQELWSHKFTDLLTGPTDKRFIIQLAVDSAENLYAVYHTVDSLAGTCAVFVKIDFAGNLLWRKTPLGSSTVRFMRSIANNKIFVLGDNTVYSFDSSATSLNNIPLGMTESTMSMNNKYEFIAAGQTFNYDSTIILKFDSSFNSLWGSMLYPPTPFPLLSCSDSTAYIITKEIFSGYTVNAIDNSGNLNWSSFVNANTPLDLVNWKGKDLFVSFRMFYNTPGASFIKYNQFGAVATSRIDTINQFVHTSVNDSGNFCAAYSNYIRSINSHINLYDSLATDSISISYNNMQSQNDYAVNATKDQNGDIVFVAEMTNFDWYPRDISVFKFNSAGQKIWECPISFNDMRTQIKGITVDSLNDIYIFGEVDNNGNFGIATVCKIDHSGLILWTYYQNDTISVATSAQSLVCDDELNVYVSINANRGTVYNNAELVKINPAGQMIWRRTYDQSSTAQDYASTVLYDNHQSIQLVNSNQGAGEFLILIRDSSGVTIQNFQMGNRDTVWGGKLLIDSTGNLICYGWISNFNGNFNIGTSWYIVKTNSAGNLLNEWIDTNTVSSNIPVEAVIGGNNQIFCTGYIHNPAEIMVVALDTQCNLLWNKIIGPGIPGGIDYYPGTIAVMAPFSINIFDESGILQLYDTIYNSIWANPNDGVVALSNSFVILSNHYSDSTASDVLLRKYEQGGVIVQDIRDENFTMYPNPATERIYIVSKENFSEVFLYDMFGKQLMHEKFVSSRSHSLALPITASGILAVKIVSTQGALIKKVVGVSGR